MEAILPVASTISEAKKAAGATGYPVVVSIKSGGRDLAEEVCLDERDLTAWLAPERFRNTIDSALIVEFTA